MSLIGAELEQIWNALRASGPQRNYRLDEVRVRNFRGVKDLRVQFPYPVSVLAGANGCGKSTVLLACACAYGSDDAARPAWSPASVFPAFTDRLRGALSDDTQGAEFAYYYVDGGQPTSMTWRRGRGWSRSFMGPESAGQPKRAVHLHALANFADPAAARSHLRASASPMRRRRSRRICCISPIASCRSATGAFRRFDPARAIFSSPN